MKLAGLRLFRYRVPLREPLLLKGTQLYQREGILVRLTAEADATGWGEAAPLPGFSKESLEEAADQLLGLSDTLVGRDVTRDALDPDGPFARELDAMDLAPSARFGFELALWDLYAATAGKPLPELVSADPRPTVALSALISSSDRAPEEARQAQSAGYEAVKLKVGARGVDEDVELVRAVHEALGGAAALRLDANRAWGIDEAERFSRGVDGLAIDYVEEPLADPELLPVFAANHDLPLALDESLVGMRAETLRGHEYASAVVLKPTLIGGISRTLRFARAASRIGARPVLSSAYETGVGTTALVALAAGVGEEGTPAGWDTYRRLARDVLLPPPELTAPRVDVPALFEGRREIDRRLLVPVG